MVQKHPLNGIKVVDLAAGMAPALVVKFLADAGAYIHRIGPRHGDPFEALYPAYSVWRSGEHGEAEPLSIDRLHELLADADVCLVGGEDYPGLDVPFDPEQLSAMHPRLVVLSISGYPKNAGFDDGRAVDILVQARTGLSFEHYSDRPIFMAFEPANYGAALHGMVGVLAALYEREGSGQGQLVTTSLFEGALTYAAYFWTTMDQPNPSASFVIPKDPRPLIFQCKDGKYIHIVLGAAGSKARLYKVLGMDYSSIDPNESGLPKLGVSTDRYFGDVELIEGYVRKFVRDELLADLWSEGIPAEAVLQPGECWSEPQIAQSGLIGSNDEGQRFVGSPIRIRWTDTHWRERATSGKGMGPLAGLKIVDMGAFVAGPYASTVLADLGAEVVKIESPAGDPNRGTLPSFASANRGKKSVTIDMKSTRGQELARQLCRNADVVMNNFRTGVSRRLGVDAETLHKAFPHLIVLESSAFGSAGPKAMNAGFDPIVQAYAGLEHRSGGESNPPLWSRTIMVDYTAGLLGAISILLCLFARTRRGMGSEINVPLVNAGVFLASDLVQESDGAFRGTSAINGEQTGRHPAECIYRTGDGWLAVAARGLP